jgi:signal transduction histidine kinase
LGLPPRHFWRRRGRGRPRPTILDDFGLEAGLRWLVEGFAARTGIQAALASRCSGRLPDETGTHLFRIVCFASRRRR